MSVSGSLQVRVSAITREAASVKMLELRPVADGDRLPPFTAGAHVDVHLADGLVRSYSLLNRQDETHRYLIAVHLDPASCGGSRFVHESVRAGDALRISAPRNNFPLEERAPQSILIAGGIGITPLWGMVQRLEALKRSWHLYYCARTREQAAFVVELEKLGSAVTFNFDQAQGGAMLDLAAVVGAAPAGAHLYCCGPRPMMQAFEQAAASLPRERVHTEYFSGAEEKASGGFTVSLAKSGQTLAVPEGSSILDALLEAGFDISYSCTEGVCGSCETRVLDGIPDHRDLILSDAEKEAGRTMMICCSGSKSDRLVLDL